MNIEYINELIQVIQVDYNHIQPTIVRYRGFCLDVRLSRPNYTKRILLKFCQGKQFSSSRSNASTTKGQAMSGLTCEEYIGLKS